jgi:dGTPase
LLADRGDGNESLFGRPSSSSVNVSPMRTRRELEEIEDRTLAPYAMRSARSAGRDHAEPEHGYRTVYQRDRDRIIHCAAFRRLEYKTQVFVNSEGDYYRTRLTHTIEVAQIARTIARALGLNEDLVEALALVHDLGHGPFGHAGEHALAECMKDHGGFEHNLQGLRTVEKLETRYPSFRGLNLSYETREGMAKHGDYLKKGSASRFHPEARPFLEALAADTADRLAYNHHDLDDGLTSGILAEREVRELPHIDAAFAAVDADCPGLPQRVRINQAFIRLMNESVSDLVTATSARLGDAKIRSVEDVRSANEPLVAFSDAGAKRHEQMHAWLYARFYSHWKVARMQETAKRFLRTVFQAYVENPRTLPPEVAERRESEGLHRAVCDFVASMTDRELHGEYRRIALP